MDNMQVLSTMGTAMILIFAVMAAAYWIDATRWSAYARSLPLGPEKEKAEGIRDSAETTFRAAIGCMLYALLVMVIPLYLQKEKLAAICKYLMLVPFVTLILMCIRYVMKRYIVPIDFNYPREDIEKQV